VFVAARIYKLISNL